MVSREKSVNIKDVVNLSVENKICCIFTEFQKQRQQVNPNKPAPHSAFQRGGLALPSETTFPVPGDGTIQRMASSPFAKVHP